jgi:hypothetical protein
MVVALLPVTPEVNARAGYHLRVYDSLLPLRLCREPHRVASQPNVVLAVLPGRPSLHSQGDVIDGTISRGLIVPAYEPSSQNNIIRRRYKYRGRIVWPDGINFTLLRSWIDDCQKWEQGSHRKCGHSFSGKTHIVSRVIDCFTREMVPLTEDMEYVALSYVWGPHKATDTTVSPKEGHSDSLPCPAPKTTEDAITAALGLRRRHLWVIDTAYGTPKTGTCRFKICIEYRQMQYAQLWQLTAMTPILGYAVSLRQDVPNRSCKPMLAVWLPPSPICPTI